MAFRSRLKHNLSKKLFFFFVVDAVFKMFACYFQCALFYAFISQKFNSAE